jgi:predicted benzoate:H+ symporter BenE
MNSVTAFLTVACVAIGAALVATGHAYWGVPFGIAAIMIATIPQKANGPLLASDRRG